MGPYGGITTPDAVMRTGSYGLFDPLNARANVRAGFIENWTRKAVGRQPMSEGIRTVAPPVPVGPIKPPMPAAPLPVNNTTPSDAQAPQAAEVVEAEAEKAMAGYMGNYMFINGFGAFEDYKSYLYGAGVGAGVGLLGGLALSLLSSGYDRKYLRNTLVGAAAGAGAGAGAVFVTSR